MSIHGFICSVVALQSRESIVVLTNWSVSFSSLSRISFCSCRSKQDHRTYFTPFISINTQSGILNGSSKLSDQVGDMQRSICSPFMPPLHHKTLRMAREKTMDASNRAKIEATEYLFWIPASPRFYRSESSSWF